MPPLRKVNGELELQAASAYQAQTLPLESTHGELELQAVSAYRVDSIDLCFKVGLKKSPSSSLTTNEDHFDVFSFKIRGRVPM